MNFLFQLLPDNVIFAIVISIFLNVFISVAGLLPSTFLTTANIIYFGFQFGLLISIVGEAVGAIISFILYKNGVKAIEHKFGKRTGNQLLERLKNARGGEAILLVLTLRILPFIPSGLVTLGASISKMKVIHFAIASTIGKIPALFIEAYSINSFLNWNLPYQIGATIAATSIIGIYYFWEKKKKQ